MTTLYKTCSSNRAVPIRRYMCSRITTGIEESVGRKLGLKQKRNRLDINRREGRVPFQGLARMRRISGEDGTHQNATTIVRKLPCDRRPR